MNLLRAACAGGMALVLSLAQAQHWEPAGLPAYLYMPSPNICYADTIHDALYVGGTCTLNGGNVGHFLLYRYQGGVWDSIGSFGNTIRTAIVYHDTLIVGGGFHTVGSQNIERIVCYVGGVWQPYGNITDDQDAGDVSRLRVINGELYALGTFDSADGHFCNGLAKRVGGHWENVGVLPAFNGDGSAWFMDAIRFQGKLVVTGNFTSADGSIHDVMEYDGVSWQPVCNCLNGGFDGGGSLIVYQGELYLGGVFHYSSGNAGQGLMKWDGGSQWSMVGQPGGGLQIYNYSDAYSPTIYDFKVRDGLLLVSGGFFYVDHIPASGIASWDGSHWCSLGGSNPYGLTAMAFYHDSLYVGCGPNADGQPVNGLARFIGSTFQENCAETGIAEILTIDQPLHVLPLGDGNIALSGLADGQHTVQVWDAQGRLVLSKQVQSQAGRSASLHVGALDEAVYLVRVDQRRTSRFVPVR